MENATKALLMVSAVLIGVMILALGAYLFSVFGNTTGSIEARIAQAQLDEFNSQFTKYDGQEDCTIHDIVSLANLAKSSNQNYDYTDSDKLSYNSDWRSTKKIENKSAPYYIYIGICGVESQDRKLIETANSTELSNLIKKYSTKEVTDENGKKSIETIYFKCDNITFNAITKRVQGVVFTARNYN